MRTKQKSGPGKVVKVAAWVLACAFSGVGLYAETEVTFELLNDTHGDTGTKLVDVSGDGSVIVGIRDWFQNNPVVFRWEDGTITEIPELRGAMAISDDGSVIAGDILKQAALWDDGVATGLGYLPGSVDSWSSTGCISGDGKVVAGRSGDEIFRWEDGVMTGLGLYFEVKNLSYDGRVMVGSSYPEAFRWEDGVGTDLGHLPGHRSSCAYDVSADGSAIVGATIISEDGMMIAWIWENGTIMQLPGPLPSIFPYSEAFAVSADGSVVLGDSYTGDTWDTWAKEPVLWHKDSGYEIVTLRSILENHGTDLTGVEFVESNLQGNYGPRLSADGTTIVGLAELNGKEVAYRVRILDVDPLIGGTPIDDLQDWFLSDWFGAYNTTLAPWIYHAQHGFIYRYPESTNASMFIYDDAMGAWWWTSDLIYPYLYAFDPPADNAGTDIESEWLWYFEGSSDPRSFGVVTGDEAGSVLFFEP